MDGACMACLAKVQQGRVYQEDPGILSDDNIANCETLTCQAKPLSRLVKISYDNI
jgi:ferredoxin